MSDLDILLLSAVVIIQIVSLVLVIFGLRKSLWASRAAFAAKGEAHKASVNTTRQLEELGSLYRKTELAWGDLPPTRGWAASPDFLNLLHDTIKDLQPATVVELGSGVSSLVTASALRQNERPGTLHTIDHEENYLLKTVQELRRLGLDQFVVARHAPLKRYEIQGRSWLWYDITYEDLPEQIDLLVVDGPPEPTVGEGGRLPVVPLMFKRLSNGGRVVFDDAGRPGEQAIFQEISNLYPDMSVVRYRTEKGTAIVKNT